MVAVIIFGLFMVLMCIGVPIILALGVSTLIGIIYAGFGESLEQLYVFPLQILEGVDAPALLAIPFFVFAGNLMNVIGVTDKIFRFASALVGHLRAGLAQVNVIGSLFFGGITGSAVADCAGIGNLVIRAMRERGYPAPYACALTVASSVIGPTMWPSVPLLIYAFSASVSVERIFLAGIGPGILIVLSLMLYNRIVAVKYNVPLEPRMPMAEVLKAAFDGMAALAAPLIIVGSILTGFATAVEAGVVEKAACTVDGFMAWLKVTEMVEAGETPVASWAGVTAVTTGDKARTCDCATNILAEVAGMVMAGMPSVPATTVTVSARLSRLTRTVPAG
jgi:tripartite ATP-independent transporter DctM subunit